MLKILTASQIRACDAYTIENEPVTSIDLMERACRAFASWFIERFEVNNQIDVVCGTGNNGGDGLGIARMLRERGFPVRVWIVATGNSSSGFKQQLEKLPQEIPQNIIAGTSKDFAFSGCDIIIDALLGTGLSRPAEGIQARIIGLMNASAAIRVAVDIPSGLFTDQHSPSPVVQAAHTVSFQLPKLAFFLPENNAFVGDWHLVDIRLNKKFIKEALSERYYLTSKEIRKRIKIRSKFENKGDHGKALLIAGSYGKMGACILAARAALRAGIGLLTIHIPKVGYQIMQIGVPEAMAEVDDDEKMFTRAEGFERYSVIGIGPGIGQDEKTAAALAVVINSNIPAVIDADALNILSSNKSWLKTLPPGCILTPHPKEFSRLAGSWSDDFERLEKQIQLARETNAVVILKGAHTSIATPDGSVFFNATGNPGMATGGSGDVLTGVLAGLRGQGYPPLDAALIGVYLHGLAGDLAAEQKGRNSLIASDLIDFLPHAFKKIARLAQ